MVLVDRDSSGLQDTAATITDAGHAAPTLHEVDLSTTGGVRALARTLIEEHPQIDILANNAGLLSDRRQETSEGFELTFAVNYLAPFLLTKLLLEVLGKSPDGRVVNTCSLAHGHGTIHFDDLQLREGYNLYKAYSQSKLALMLFTRALARRTRDTNITANCFHPGVVGTGIGEGGVMSKIMGVVAPLLRRPDRGARTLVYLATSPELKDVRGEYFVDEKRKRPKARGLDDELGERLWQHTESLLQS